MDMLKADQRSAQAAARRMQQCALRQRELSAGAGTSYADVDRARTALQNARARADQARRRLAIATERASQLRFDRLALALDTRNASPLPPSYLAAENDPLNVLRTMQLSLDLLYAQYLALGGTLGKLELDAYLHGLTPLPRLERMIVTHSLWELAEFSTAPNPRGG